MKKIATLGIIALLCAGSLAFADDAKVMPARVGRVYMTNTYAFANGSFDANGTYSDYASGGGKFQAYNMGFALEYGVIDWITGAVQWAPGLVAWSNVDKNIPLPPSFASYSTSTLNINGLYDIFAGAKFQIIGEKAPIANNMFRLAIAPGVKIPLTGPNFTDQWTNLTNGNNATVKNLDAHLFALGGRAYFDYILNKMFFFNLYSEYIYYPIDGKFKNLDPTSSLLATNYSALVPDNVNLGYKLTLEAEPHFETMVSDGIQFSAGLPITFITTPDISFDKSISTLLAGKYDPNSYKSSSTLSLGPNASFFFMKSLLPVELKLGYSFPVYGKNSPATNALTLQAKVYFKL